MPLKCPSNRELFFDSRRRAASPEEWSETRLITPFQADVGSTAAHPPFNSSRVRLILPPLPFPQPPPSPLLPKLCQWYASDRRSTTRWRTAKKGGRQQRCGDCDSWPRIAGAPSTPPPQHVISGESQEGQRDYCRIWDPSERWVKCRPAPIVVLACEDTLLRNLPTKGFMAPCTPWGGTDFMTEYFQNVS